MNENKKFESIKKAFTLIELMVVLVVISILVGITLPIAGYVARRAARAQYEAQMAKITGALEEYRAKYGEYPVTPVYSNPATGQTETNSMELVNFHYPTNGFLTECYLADTNQPFSPFTNVNHSTNWPTREDLPGRTVYYDLTYPLMLRQELNNEPPIMEFPFFTVVYYAWSGAGSRVYEYERTVRRRLSDGRTRSRDARYTTGAPINRPMAFDPRNSRQYKYMSDGMNYVITNY